MPAPQLLPHCPQFFASALRSAHPIPLPQATWPIAQTHWPETQVPEPQLLPHWPQLVGSELRSAQPIPLPHIVCPILQTHCPDVHVPAPQFLLQPPQCAWSLETSKHPSAHVMSPASQVHTLFTQLAPGLRVTLPHMTPPLELEAALLDVVPLVAPVAVEPPVEALVLVAPPAPEVPDPPAPDAVPLAPVAMAGCVSELPPQPGVAPNSAAPRVTTARGKRREREAT